MSANAPRRPRFLASVPAAPQPAPLRFAAPGAAPEPPAAGRSAAAPQAEGTGRAAADRREARREAMERVAAAVATLRAQAGHLGEQARADALEIGFVVARALLQQEVRADPAALFALVRQAMRRAAGSRTITVRLAPDDAALVRAEAGQAAIDGAAGAAAVEIVADATLSRGDCVVDADFGRVDGRLETRLAELRRAVEADAGAEDAA
jgi:flagellar assembly protein FliH